MRKSVDINELMKKRDAILEEIRKVPNKQRDYTEYRKVSMKIKYYTDENEREKQIEYGKERFKHIYSNEETRKKYADYHLSLYHNRKGNIDKVNNNITVC